MVDCDAPAPCWWVVRRVGRRLMMGIFTYPRRRDAMAYAQSLNSLVGNTDTTRNPNRMPGAVRYLVVGRHELDAFPHLFTSDD